MDRHKIKQHSTKNHPSLYLDLPLVNGKLSSAHSVKVVQTILIQIIAVLTILQLAACATTTTTTVHTESHDEEHLKNPLVFDLNTLYDKTRLATTTDSNRRFKRSTSGKTSPTNINQDPSQQLVDACQSKVEVLTPYYATNSKGKLRTVVNSALMQQAIQVETCVRSPSADRAKCNAQPDCGCEQKYKWHRLLVMDTSDSGASRGLFMDWFLYPSACVCRCRPAANPGKQFLRSIKKSNETPINQ